MSAAVTTTSAAGGGERRLAIGWRLLPLLIAVALAALELSCLGGVFHPDTAAFLTHTWHARLNLSFPTFNPAYPLLLDLLCLVLPAGARMAALVVLQQACVVAIPWLVLRSGERLGRPRAGVGAALLTALHAPLSLFAQSALSDSLFAFLLALAGYAFVRAWTRSLRREWWLAGALAAGAMALRSSGVALLAAAAVALLAGALVRREPRLLRFSLLHFSLGFASMLALVLAKNRYDFGRATLVDGDGIHLFCRAAALEGRFPPTPEVARLERVAAAGGLPSLFVPQAGWRLHQLLLEHEKLSATDADDLLATAARQALLLDPWRSARLTLASMVTAVRPANALGYTIGSGLDAESARRHAERTRATWSASPERFAKALALLPPYPPDLRRTDLRARLIAGLAHGARAWGGAWVLVALLGAGVIGLLRRDPPLLFFAGLPIAQLAASAIGEVPFAGHFDPVVPATWLTLALAVAALRAPRR